MSEKSERKTQEEQFLEDVADQKMEIIRDDDLYRHIRFREPGTICMGFDLITWPGHLCYTGDMGTYTFSRVRDMFGFFRMNERDIHRNPNGLSINPGYWAEKCLAADRDGIKEFSEEVFTEAVMEDLIEWIRNNRHDTTKEERRELWDEVISSVIQADGDSGGWRKQCAAHDFRHYVNDEVGDFSFQDFWEKRVDAYTHRYIWCCYALAWGIKQYDDAKAAQAATVA